MISPLGFLPFSRILAIVPNLFDSHAVWLARWQAELDGSGMVLWENGWEDEPALDPGFFGYCNGSVQRYSPVWANESSIVSCIDIPTLAIWLSKSTMSLLTHYLLLAAVALTGVAADTADAPASAPRITSVKYSGQGCPQGSDSVARTGDFGNLGFKFSKFAANSPGTSSTTACEVHVQASGGSSGWQVSLADIWVKGHAVLQPGACANYFTTAFWSDDPTDTVTVRGTLNNDDDKVLDVPVTIHNSVPTGKSSWSQCIGGDGNPGILNVNFRVALSDERNIFTVDAEDVKFRWRQC
ncbi:uncharacterized protein E0L32_003757 [Thyridium curvatum]|uniref:Secreted protein n=1 Tax=Thyridium curvatum TaxID=1093900 RepID=A0A507BA28_9PEZI|nr:uncharacterized protein E0L32_003757 [Thyridium curvatum]TPX16463.1 hypothetical protein E0L32_003757 [Thyridium curvatum]